MRTRGVIGVVLVLIGAVWIAQGTGAVHGSMMSGHGQYAVLGAVVLVLGVVLLGWNLLRRGRGRR